MSSNVRGEVPLMVCGRQLSIAPTYRALEAIETRLNCSVIDLLGRSVNGSIRIRDMATIVHEGLRGAGHSGGDGKTAYPFEIEQIGDDVLANFGYYAPLIGTFLGNALGGASPKGSAGQKARPKRRSRSRTSTK